MERYACFADERFPLQVDSYSVPLEYHYQFGELLSSMTQACASGSRSNGTGISGVTAFAAPTLDCEGQLAGFWLKTESGQAWFNVVKRGGASVVPGRERSMLLAWEPNTCLRVCELTCRLACHWIREVCPKVDALNCGLNVSTAQLVAWKGTRYRTGGTFA